MTDKASKTEKATPKKVSDARKKGQVAKSQEVSAWTTTLVMTLLVPLTFDQARQHVLQLVTRMQHLISEPETGPALALFADGLLGGMLAVAPMAVGLMLVGVGANLAQVGFTPSPEALTPKLSKLNPLPGLKRMVGTRSLWGAGKELLKLVPARAAGLPRAHDVVPQLVGGSMPLPSLMPPSSRPPCRSCATPRCSASSWPPPTT
jgi:flagellar biosynthetic protein FlhB